MISHGTINYCPQKSVQIAPPLVGTNYMIVAWNGKYNGMEGIGYKAIMRLHLKMGIYQIYKPVVVWGLRILKTQPNGHLRSCTSQKRPMLMTIMPCYVILWSFSLAFKLWGVGKNVGLSLSNYKDQNSGFRLCIKWY